MLFTFFSLQMGTEASHSAVS